MEQFLSDRVRQMTLSPTLAMASKTRELKAQGKNIINLSIGEPDFDIPDFIKKSAIQAIENNYSKYPPVDGYLELKQAICQKLKRDNNLIYNHSQIVVSTGAKQCLANVAMAMLNKNDEVILPTPCWSTYAELVKLCEAVPIEVLTSIENHFKITPEQLEKAITPRTKMLWISTPSNPTGAVYSQTELESLAVVLRKYPNIFIVSDEIYEYICFERNHVSIAQIKGLYERTITINGVSKAFAMTGWRIGYMAAPEWIARACSKIQGQITSGANSVAQRAVITALTSPPQVIRYMVEEFQKRRNIIVKELSDIHGFNINMPQGAFYIFADISYFFEKTLRNYYIKNATDFSIYLLEQAQVATVTGEAFGDHRCIRISYASSERELYQAIRRIKKALL